MARIHAFEFEDLQWFPQTLRNYGTDFLQFVANRFDIYKSIVPLLARVLSNTGNTTIIDVASGGGGGLLRLSSHLKTLVPSLQIVLTDYYPNIPAFKKTKDHAPEVFTFRAEQVNAMNVPANLKGLRTQFLSFHHFRPADAKAILQNAVDRQQPIAIFEAQQRNIKSMIPMLLSPITVLLTTPFIKPFSLGRIFFTYLAPVVPLFVLWDGVISVLRTYSTKELKEMVDGLSHATTFDWSIGVQKANPGEILYLVGIPKK